jgi:hypothetical protein
MLLYWAVTFEVYMPVSVNVAVLGITFEVYMPVSVNVAVLGSDI